MEHSETNPRTPSFPVDRLFLDRWSPRAFDPAPLPRETVLTLFEAARWAPSCFNEQPWLFIWGTELEDRIRILGLLNERNRNWAKNAPLIAVLFARRKFKGQGKDNRWAGFDSGSAWMSLALQARLLGLYAHAMGGFDQELACELLGVPGLEYEAICTIAVGRHAEPQNIPEEMREREKPDTERKALEEIQHEGILKKP